MWTKAKCKTRQSCESNIWEETCEIRRKNPQRDDDNTWNRLTLERWAPASGHQWTHFLPPKPLGAASRWESRLLVTGVNTCESPDSLRERAISSASDGTFKAPLVPEAPLWRSLTVAITLRCTRFIIHANGPQTDTNASSWRTYVSHFWK